MIYLLDFLATRWEFEVFVYLFTVCLHISTFITWLCPTDLSLRNLDQMYRFVCTVQIQCLPYFLSCINEFELYVLFWLKILFLSFHLENIALHMPSCLEQLYLGKRWFKLFDYFYQGLIFILTCKGNELSISLCNVIAWKISVWMVRLAMSWLDLIVLFNFLVSCYLYTENQNLNDADMSGRESVTTEFLKTKRIWTIEGMCSCWMWRNDIHDFYRLARGTFHVNLHLVLHVCLLLDRYVSDYKILRNFRQQKKIDCCSARIFSHHQRFIFISVMYDIFLRILAIRIACRPPSVRLSTSALKHILRNHLAYLNLTLSDHSWGLQPRSPPRLPP